MKHFFSILVFSGFCALDFSEALAQETALAGFVFANAIGVNAKADVTANGKKLTRKGLEPGMATSGLGLPIGTYDVQVTALGCETAKATVQLAVGSTPVLVAYLDRVTDPRSNTVKNFIKLRQLPSVSQEAKYSINVIAIDPTVLFNVTANGQTQKLQSPRPIVVETKAVTITDSVGAATEAKVDEKGNYYCFVFRQADGKPGHSLVLQRIYQW